MDALPAPTEGAGEFVDGYRTAARAKEEEGGGVVDTHACDEELLDAVF